MKKTMKWKVGVVLSVALLVGFAALGVRPSEAVGTDVFDRDSRLYVPYWRVDPGIDTILVVENPFGPGSNATIRFYDQSCNFVRDFHPDLTTEDVDFIDIGAVMSPILAGSPREGGLIITTDAFGGTGGAALTAETIVVNGVDGSILRFHHINENDGGAWTTFESNWTGAYFDANNIDNELFLFCPGPVSSGSFTSTKLHDDLIALAASPVGSATSFSKKVDIFFFDDRENELISVPLSCGCVTRVLLHNLTSLVRGTAGRILVTSDPADGGDGEDFIAFMKRQIRGTPFQVNGYMFSN